MHSRKVGCGFKLSLDRVCEIGSFGARSVFRGRRQPFSGRAIIIRVRLEIFSINISRNIIFAFNFNGGIFERHIEDELRLDGIGKKQVVPPSLVKLDTGQCTLVE